MSTQIFLRTSKTHPGAIGAYRDILRANALATQQSAISGVSPTGSEVQLFVTGETPVSFYSERVNDASVTISGTVTLMLRGNTTQTATARLRARLYKVTAGGSDVETLIGQAEMTANLTTTATDNTLTFTPPSPVTVVRNERFILRVYAFPDPSTGSWGTSTSNAAVMPFGSGSTTAFTNITFTETITFRNNGTKLWFRRTNTLAIGSFFDLIDVIGSSAATDAIVNTVANATRLQWTRTAGGSNIEWITKRIKGGWTFSSAANVAGTMYAMESNASANVGIQMELSRRQPDGTETLVWTKFFGELGTVIGNIALTSGTLVAVTNFAEDDRLVARVFALNSGGAMAGGFNATFRYDVNVDLSQGSAQVQLLDSPEFKEETDPAGTSRIEGGLTMGGVGN